jgi:tetraprenyl-beta-curcumene synthase
VHSIPDATLRADALEALDRKRANIEGAALFWVIPHRRNRDLLRLLVAYEVMADYLDGVSERGAHVGPANGVRLHRALVEAIDPRLAVSDHYRLHPWKDDCGYLRELIGACRDFGPRLASYTIARPLILRGAQLAQEVLPLNHEPHPARRDAYLSEWAATQFPECDGLEWFERTGAASAWLTILSLLALAAEPDLEPWRVRETSAAYLPWVCLAGTMLDSYGDMAQDAARDAHNYIAHYPDMSAAAARIAKILARSTTTVRRLPDGRRHAVIVACMAAMYLSKDAARAPQLRAHTRAIACAGGSLTRVLLPVLRLWRLVYRLRSA